MIRLVAPQAAHNSFLNLLTCWCEGRRVISEEWSSNKPYKGRYTQISTFSHHPSPFHPTPRMWYELSHSMRHQRTHMGHDHRKPGFLHSTACKAACFIKINAIHFSGSIQRERIMFEQHKTPSMSSISSGKWGFVSDHPHLSSLPIHCWGLLVDLFTYKMSSASLALASQNSQLIVSHIPRTWRFYPLGLFYPFAVAFPTRASLEHTPAHVSH